MGQEAVWLVAGGPMQFHIATQIKERGYRLVVSDGSDDAFCRRLADEFIVLDTFDVPGHLAALQQLRRKFDFVCVMTVGADCHETVNAIRIALQHPHYPPEVSKICRNKSKQRNFFSERGFLQPDAFAFSDFQDARKLVSSREEPLVIKADNNSGSRGFSELVAGQVLSFGEFERARSESSSGVVVLETLLTVPRQSSHPAELSAESMWVDGEFFALNAVDRFFSRDAWLLEEWTGRKISARAGIEIGHLNSSTRTHEELSEVFEILREAGSALGLDRVSGATPLKADVFFTDEGPVILEITPRLSGGWDSSASTLERGADFQTAQLLLTIDSTKNLEPAIELMRFEGDAASFAFVLAIPPLNAVDNIGREFFLGVGDTPDQAALVASDNAHKGESILQSTNDKLQRLVENK